MPKVPPLDPDVLSTTGSEPIFRGNLTVEMPDFDFENIKGIESKSGSHAINSGKRRYDYPTAEKYDLQTGQVRVMHLLFTAMKDGVALSRQRISAMLGMSPISGTPGTWFEGIGEGTKRGRARKGLFAHGFVEEETLDVEGVKERVLSLTSLGMEVAAALDSEHKGGTLIKEKRTAKDCTNRRYMVD